MFFDAMRRKNYSPRMEDMKTVVPIHNAVNERAWKEIQEWERGRGAEKYAFKGLFSLQHI
jgi:cytochrome c heme-lyase